MFTDFAKEGGAVLLVTHTLPVAQEISDRIGFLKNGELVAVGTLDELRKQAHVSKDADLQEIYKTLA
jgi:ABC-2 type transport system ATP-binding protein